MVVLTVTFFCSSLVANGANQAHNTNQKDKIVVRLPRSRGRITLRGTIINYTGSSILIRSSVNASVKEFPTSSVVKVSTSHVAPYLQGMTFFSQKKYLQATRSFEKAIQQEDRKWVRREILAMLVRCALQAGDDRVASSRFLTLTESDAETFYFHLIPLQWTPSPLGNLSRLNGLAWLQNKSATTRLLGASRLLLDEKYGQFATTEMKALATNIDRRIRSYARMQLWRLELQHPKKLTKFQLERWRKEIERTPSSYRAGGWYLLGMAYSYKREYEQSATAFLWLPLVYDQDKFLAARSCYEGAESLLQIGKKHEAKILLQEVVKRFGETPAAQEAAIALKKLQQR
ncbi:hypothetical protein MNBD_PLANCTO02-440 [hydrothermal vent metagenome]|uniref:Tetratricopeptide repeat protein n=1 Tax=hydrothermal vent metagenome TaxID=652676 RepID=A0A3B1DK75_9ZZZZ